MSLNPHDGPTRRLFFALWPDEGIREELDRVSRHAVRKRGKRVRGENLHITLAFIGQVPADTASCLRQAAAEIRGQRFTLRLDRIGYWPRPRIMTHSVMNMILTSIASQPATLPSASA